MEKLPIYKAWEHNFTKSKCKILSVKKLGLSAYNNEIKAIFLLVKFLTPEKLRWNGQLYSGIHPWSLFHT